MDTMSRYRPRPPSPTLTNPDMILPPASQAFPSAAFQNSTISSRFIGTLRPLQLQPSQRFSVQGSSPLPKTVDTPLASVYGSSDFGSSPPRQQAYARTGNADELVRQILDEDENTPGSHAQLSLKAEEILANAKKRLSAMEGNLNRARTLSLTRSASVASIHESSNANRQSINAGKRGSNTWAVSAAKLRQAAEQGTLPSPGHLRGLSDSNTRSPTLLKQESSPDLRSASAFEMSSSPRLMSPEWPLPNNSRRRQLDTLMEDEASSTGESSVRGSPALPPAPRVSSQSRLGRSSVASFRSLNRSSSSLSIRDIHDQMQDLKGKVATLKQRNAEDKLRRRSLQALRQPSPFTHAPGWVDPPDHRSGSSEAASESSGHETSDSSLPQTNGTADLIDEVELPKSKPQDEDEELNAEEKELNLQRASNATITPQDVAPKKLSYIRISQALPSPKEDALPEQEEEDTLPEQHLNDIDEIPSSPPADVNYPSSPILPPSTFLANNEPDENVILHEDRPDHFDYEAFALAASLNDYAENETEPAPQSSPSRSTTSSLATTRPELNGYSSSFSSPELLSATMHAKQNATYTTQRAPALRRLSSESSSSFLTANERNASRSTTRSSLSTRQKLRSQTSLSNSRNKPRGISDATIRGFDNSISTQYANAYSYPSARPSSRQSYAESVTSPLDGTSVSREKFLEVMHQVAFMGGSSPGSYVSLHDEDDEAVVSALAEGLWDVLRGFRRGDRGAKSRVEGVLRALDGDADGEAF